MKECLRAVIQIVVPIARRLRGLAEVAERLAEGCAVLLLGEGEHQSADGRARGVGAAVGGVTETALRRLARLEIFQTGLDGRLRHGQPGVARGEQGDHLRAADGGVGVGAVGRVAPTAARVFFLRIDDQPDRLLERRAKPVVLHRAVRLGQRQRGEAVVVHRRADVAGGLVLPAEDEVDAALDRLAVRAVDRVVPVREHRHHRQADHRRRCAVRLVLEIAGGELRLHEVLQPPRVHALDFLGQQVARLLKQLLRPGGHDRRKAHYDEQPQLRSPPHLRPPSNVSTALK